MEWFDGGVREAIAAAQAKKTVFVVVVTGLETEEGTKKVNEVLTDPEVVSKFSSMVCIKLENGSTTCSQFAAIYPVILIPSIYFIGNILVKQTVFIELIDIIFIDSSTGVDMEITGGIITKESLFASFAKVCDKQEGGNMAPGVDSNVSASPAAATSSTSNSTAAASAEQSSGVSVSLQERVERAKMLVEQRKMEKEQEENDKEKSKEMERREIGKAMLERKRLQEEKELKEAAAQRRKDKEEEKLARERVKAQLEQDKLDKKMKFQAEKQAEDELRKEREKKALAAAAEQAEKLAADRATTARIQFRLPDGSSQTQHFPADSPLSDLYSFVRTGMTPSYSAFSLSTAFPRRNLDTQNMESSLKDLQMAPSSTVMVLPSTSMVSSQDGGLMSLIWLILSPFSMLWSMMTSFFSTTFGSSSTTSSSGPSSGGGSSRAGRDGAVGRLRNSEFSDDDMNTYNGNSTQQM